MVYNSEKPRKLPTYLGDSNHHAREYKMAKRDYIFNIDFLLHLFDIDVKEGKLYWKNPSKYHNNLIGKEAGNAQANHCNKKYWVISIDGLKVKRGHIIFFIANKFKPSPCIDHIDGNSLNDKIENLREATITENSWNHKTRKRATKLPMGIRKSPSGKFVARIAVNNNQIHLGTYEFLEEAHNVYLEARKRFYGQFA